MYVDPTGKLAFLTMLFISMGVGFIVSGGFEIGKQVQTHGWNLSKWNWAEIGTAALIGAANGLAYGLGGIAGGILKGSFQALSIAGKTLTTWQSVGVLFGVSAVTNFATGFASYAANAKESNTGNFNIFKGFSEGTGQMLKGLLSFLTAGMYVGAGLWNVGADAKNTLSSIIERTVSRFIVNYIPNYIFDELF